MTTPGARSNCRTQVPWWAVCIVLGWGACVAAAELWSRHGGQPVTLCHVRRLTGIPCPTCGSTRAAFALLEGRPLAAIAHNPLVVLSGLGAGAWLAAWAVRGLRPEMRLSARAKRCLPWLLILAVAANWAYVLVHEVGR